MPKSPGNDFSKSPNFRSQKKFTKSPDNINKRRSYKSPDLKRRRGWRNKPPTPYKNMTHEKVEQREEYAHLDHMESAGEYRECTTTIEEPLHIIHEIEHIEDIDDTILS